MHLNLRDRYARRLHLLKSALRKFTNYGAPYRVSSEIKLEAVLAAMQDSVAIFDNHGNLVDFNDAFAALHRFKNKQDCARAIKDYPRYFNTSYPDGTQLSPSDWPVIRALQGESGTNQEMIVVRNDTKERWSALYNFAPIHVNSGEIAAAVITARDVTDAKQREEDLRNISSRLHLALSSARLGVWEWDIVNNKLTWDDRMFELYGITRNDFAPSADVDAWSSQVHPDDRQAALDLLSAAVRGQSRYSTEFRVVHPNGNIVYLKADGLVERNQEGVATRMLGVNGDITAEREAHAILQRAYSEVEAKVYERTSQLEAAKSAAENASKAKDLFLATLSHELRSPLSAILSWAQLMERGVLGPEKMQTAVHTIKESAWSQNQIIGDLLDLSRIATGKLHIDQQPTNINEVLKVAIDSTRPIAEQRNLSIIEHISQEPLYVSADPARLKQSFWNILSNAVKFTPSGGSITIDLTVASEKGYNYARVSIRDTGKGIKAEFLPHLFERFCQADPSSVRVHGGMGLGLSLVHSLVTLQGGTVTADSPGEGQGATFTLSFPIIALMEPAVGPTNGVSHSHRLVEQDSLKNIKILLVEDGNETRLALEHLLASQGATVRAEASAQDGLATFKSFHPDVIVSDIAMPQEDGHTMLRKIRSLSVAEGATTPAIALTAYAEPRDREQAFASGFQEYLNKPVDSSVLSHAILKLSKSKPARLQSEIDCRIQSVEHRELGPSPSPA